MRATPPTRLKRWQLTVERTPSSDVPDDAWPELLEQHRTVFDISMEALQRSVRSKQHLYRVRERATGRLVGVCTSGVRWVDLADGRRVRAMYGGDAVFFPEIRGAGILQELGVRELVAELLRHPLSRHYMFGGALTYKMYLAIARTFPGVVPRRGAEVPPELHAVMETVGPVMYGALWRGVGHPVDVQRRPHAGQVEITAAELADPDVAFYAERNPTYAEGTALPLVIPLDWPNVRALLRKLLGVRLGRRRASR